MDKTIGIPVHKTLITNTMKLSSGRDSVPEWDLYSKNDEFPFLAASFQADNADQDQSHVKELPAIIGLFKTQDIHQLNPEQGQPHPNGQRRGGRDLPHSQREKDNIPHPKYNITKERPQDQPAFPME